MRKNNTWLHIHYWVKTVMMRFADASNLKEPNISINLSWNFQHCLFLRITTLLSWLKSTLLLKSKCFGTTIYMKTQCLQTNQTQNYWKWRKKYLRSGRRSRERVALIKSLIYARWKSHAWGAVAKSSWKCQLIKDTCENKPNLILGFVLPKTVTSTSAQRRRRA